jgi:ABC-type sulfate transport system permease subunit
VLASLSLAAALAVLLLCVLYVALCWAIARHASNKGQSFALFFTLGLIVSPLISLIVALFIDERAPADS